MPPAGGGVQAARRVAPTHRARRKRPGKGGGCILLGQPRAGYRLGGEAARHRSEEHTSELQSLMRISYAVFCLKKKRYNKHTLPETHQRLRKYDINHVTTDLI